MNRFKNWNEDFEDGHVLLDELATMALLEGDHDAGIEFFERIDAVVRWWAKGVDKLCAGKGVHESSEEVVQTTLLRIFNKKPEELLASVKKSGNWITYILTIRKNLIIDEFRKKYPKKDIISRKPDVLNRKGGLDFLDRPVSNKEGDKRTLMDTIPGHSIPSPEDVISYRRQQEHLAKLEEELFEVFIPSLPPEQRDIIELYCKNLSYKEIARLLNIQANGKIGNTVRATKKKITNYFKDKVEMENK